MPIPESTLAQWSHPRSAKASKQAHLTIREALAAHEWPAETQYEVFLQGSYKNGTNLSRDSDVDVVVRLAHKLHPSVAALTGRDLASDASHKTAYKQWHSFRRHAMKAVRVRFGDDVTSGRKTLKLKKGRLQADADLVVTLSYKEGVGLYLPDERRWIVSYPQQHHRRGVRKERGTNKRFKKTIRMFKVARNELVSRGALTKEDAPSYFVECLLYNAPNELFAPKLAPTYTGVLTWLKGVKLKALQSQSGQVPLFGPGREQWKVEQGRAFATALQGMWDTWN
ncbi:MAG: nucleotidyltransferase [Dehalococcoidia bacterium]|nr:nucleotidyltransferase [Dehalococcoidia bacterium]MYD29794.1 nucleotidyltransferase [Dehalococcoidia bacterium]